MSHAKLKAKLREKKEKKTEDEIPAVIYGPHKKTQSIRINYKDFSKTYESAGESTLIDMSIEGYDPVKVLIHEIQKDPVSQKYIHVDFYQLDMNKKLKVEVELEFKGIEEVEKLTGGEVIKNMDKLEVECLPKDLVKEIEIDVRGKLKEIGDILYAKEIKLPEGLKLVIEENNPVLSLQEIKEEIIEQEEIEPSEQAQTESEGQGGNDGKTEQNIKTEDKKQESNKKE